MQMEHKKYAYIQNQLTSKSHSVKDERLYVIVCCIYTWDLAIVCAGIM
jgi:hypothetical protein